MSPHHDVVTVSIAGKCSACGGTHLRSQHRLVQSLHLDVVAELASVLKCCITGSGGNERIETPRRKLATFNKASGGYALAADAILEAARLPFRHTMPA